MATNSYVDRWPVALNMQQQATQDPWLAQAAGGATMQALLNVPQSSFSSGVPGARTGGAVNNGGGGGSSSNSNVSSSVNQALSAFAPAAGGNVSASLGADDGQFAGILELIKGILPGFSKDAAFSDASALMNQRAQIENQKNQPVIQRAVEGAGTSGSSMSALLAGRMAADTAQNAAALGAEQATKYGGIQANLSGLLAQMASTGDPRAKLLASILETGMQTEASTRNAQIGAEAAKAGANAQVTRSINDFATQQQLMEVQQQQQESRTQSPAAAWGPNWASGNSSTPSTTSRY